jgi:hypothetical protein
LNNLSTRRGRARPGRLDRVALRRHIIEIAGTSPAMTRIYVLPIQNDRKPL